jgi:hypothetical protein
MSLRFGPCQLLFNVSAANSSSFPQPGKAVQQA